MGKMRINGLECRPFERAMDIVVRLQSGQILNAEKIAELYGLTKRQGYRVIREISIALPVVETTNGVCWISR